MLSYYYPSIGSIVQPLVILCTNVLGVGCDLFRIRVSIHDFRREYGGRLIHFRWKWFRELYCGKDKIECLSGLCASVIGLLTARYGF